MREERPWSRVCGISRRFKCERLHGTTTTDFQSHHCEYGAAGAREPTFFGTAQAGTADAGFSGDSATWMAANEANPV
jgi:hypothetical protein